MTIMKRKLQARILKFVFVVPMFYGTGLYADEVPVIHADGGSSTHRPLSTEQRMRQMETKLEFLSQANLVEDMQAVRQKLQELQGIIELQKHHLEKLERQQKDFYSDIDRRLSQSTMTEIKSKTAAVSATDNNKVVPPIKKSEAFNLHKHADNRALSQDDRGQKSYQNAYHLISVRRYQDALAALEQFITDYPKSPYVANAHYWLGELYVQKGERQLALQQFELIKARYPTNTKIADAKYKIGLLNKAEGNSALARSEFSDLIRRYGGTAAAELAAVQLRSMSA